MLYSSKNEHYIRSIIERMSDQEKYFNVLRKIGKNANLTQRELAKELGYSLGKLNYCLKELQDKGFVKIKHLRRNLRRNPSKISYLRKLTTKGLTEKTKLTINFMKKKMKEYDELKKELDNKDNKTQTDE